MSDLYWLAGTNPEIFARHWLAHMRLIGWIQIISDRLWNSFWPRFTVFIKSHKDYVNEKSGNNVAIFIIIYNLL